MIFSKTQLTLLISALIMSIAMLGCEGEGISSINPWNDSDDAKEVIHFGDLEMNPETAIFICNFTDDGEDATLLWSYRDDAEEVVMMPTEEYLDLDINIEKETMFIQNTLQTFLTDRRFLHNDQGAAEVGEPWEVAFKDLGINSTFEITKSAQEYFIVKGTEKTGIYTMTWNIRVHYDDSSYSGTIKYKEDDFKAEVKILQSLRRERSSHATTTTTKNNPT